VEPSRKSKTKKRQAPKERLAQAASAAPPLNWQGERFCLPNLEMWLPFNSDGKPGKRACPCSEQVSGLEGDRDGLKLPDPCDTV
jgi:hypothetical protein